MDDELRTLAAAAAAGDTSARDRLLGASLVPARRAARRLVGDDHTAEDVAQEALAEVLTRIATLREPGAYLGWLRLIVGKHADRHRRRTRPTMVLDLVIEPVADGPDPALAAERGERVERVRQALRVARDADRLLLGLRYYGEWTDTELAELLGISAGAVRKRLYDARARLRPVLTDASQEERMPTAIPDLFGHIIDPMSGPDLPNGPVLTTAPSGKILQTGIKALDAVVPWPCGGTVDFLGPVGTGHLAILVEILHNLLTQGPAALVAVAATEPSVDGSWPRLQKLIEPPGNPAATMIVQTSASHAADAIRYGSRYAAALAENGLQVLLVIDRAIAHAIGETAFDSRVGRTSAGGSVTGIRAAPHGRSAAPVTAWTTADATTVTSLDELAAERYPAIDLLASSSSVLQYAPIEHQQAAAECRRLLADATAIRAYLTQHFWMAEEHTGIHGEAFSTEASIQGLAALTKR